MTIALEGLRAVGALLVVLGILAGSLWLVRRHGLRLPGADRPRRLAITERLAIDGRTALALVRRDGVEHLLLLGANGALLVETGIAAGNAPPARGLRSVSGGSA